MQREAGLEAENIIQSLHFDKELQTAITTIIMLLKHLGSVWLLLFFLKVNIYSARAH